ncbi:MAG: glycosyltransferase family 2 protein [Anaerolineales bacterium]
MPSPLASIILVAWNSAAYLPRCLESLAAQTFTDFEIIVIDNGSTDGCVDDLPARWPGLNLRLVPLPKNTGFSAANNLGARLARGEWLALLNTDAFPESAWLENLLRAAGENPQYHFFSSRQLSALDAERLDGDGDAYHVSGLAWRWGLGYPAASRGLENREVFGACGAAALYRRDVFLQVGGFDEDLFSYLEDVDLSFRLRLAGHRCLYVANAIVHHIASASLGVASDFALYHANRNMVWIWLRNMPDALLWRFLLQHLFANLIYVLYYLSRGRGALLLRAKRDAWRGLPKIWQKRKITQAGRIASDAELLAVMERGLLQPYLLGVHLRAAWKRHK